jgi:hypothetical protein
MKEIVKSLTLIVHTWDKNQIVNTMLHELLLNYGKKGQRIISLPF